MLWRWGLAAVVTLWGSHAWAGDAEARAEALFREGLAAWDRGELEHARTSFAESLRLVPRGATLRNMAQVEIKEGRPVEGVQHLKEALGYPDLSGDRRGVPGGADRRARVQAELEEAYTLIGRISVDAAPGTAVAVDGLGVAGAAPFADPIDVAPGHHLMTGRLEGQTAQVEVDARAGAVSRVQIRFPESPPREGATPAPRPSQALPGRPAPVEASPRPDGDGFWFTRRYVGVGLVAVGIGGWVASGLFASAAAHDEDRVSGLSATLGPMGCAGPGAPASCADLGAAHESAQSERRASTALLMGGFVAAGAGAALILWPGSKAGRSQGATPKAWVAVGLKDIRVNGEF